MSMGMDSGWFTSLPAAYFDSMASADIPIWRVFKIDDTGTWLPISDEGPWDVQWKQVEVLRLSDPTGKYFCHHTISFGTMLGE
jgi:hypothetical protein